ncbi:MAG: thioredoxin-disulfide reductase [Candidatus Peregrinibacteria bacterium]
MSDIYDVLIIGAGPAGYTAAIYASRASLKVLCFEGWQPGGQLTTTTVIENFPGFENGISGPQLMQEMRKQAAKFGTQYVTKNVTKVDFSAKPFKVYVGDEEYQGKSVIVATGAKSRALGLESEKRLWGKGVSTCATCDGFFFKGKVVAVLGGGDSAMEEAGFLSKHASKVYVIHRREGFRASEIMLNRAKANSKIEFMLNKTVEEVLGETKVAGLRLKDTQSGKTSELPLDGIFLAIGHDPATQFLNGQITIDKKGYVVPKEHTMTNVEGIFAAGDCVDHRYRQAITAAGMGCQAAMDVEKWLDSSENL